MDAWTEKHLQAMKSGGNVQCRAFLQKWGVNADFDRSKIKERYESPAAELYREVLKARIEGRPEPTELPERKESSKPAVERKMEGFGSSPHPSSLPPKKKKFSRKAIIAGVASAAIGVGAVAIQLSQNNR